MCTGSAGVLQSQHQQLDGTVSSILHMGEGGRGVIHPLFVDVCLSLEISVTVIYTVEPPNKGHVGTRSFVLYREVSFIKRYYRGISF